LKTQKQKLVLTVAILAALATSPLAWAKLRKWNQKMQELGKTFSELLPELSDSKPITPASQKILEKGSKKLLDLAHTINMGSDTKGNPLPPEADPTINFVSAMFEREVKYAHNAIKAGNTAYGKAVLRTMSGYCIACHTRHDRGPDFPGMDLAPKTSGLTPMEKADLLAATRQFEAALSEYENIVSDSAAASKNAIQWGRAIRNALNLIIRVKKDPARAVALIERVKAMPQIPGFYAGVIPAWSKSVTEWKEEGAKTFNTEEGYFSEAMRLSQKAKETQEYPLDHSADVLYLRSTAVLHELLAQYPDGKRTSEALLLAGSAYDLLEDRLISPLPEMYYESCIRRSPHTKIANQCLQRLEQNILFGYSGSGGTFIPEDVLSLMNELRKLSQIPK